MSRLQTLFAASTLFGVGTLGLVLRGTEGAAPIRLEDVRRHPVKSGIEVIEAAVRKGHAVRGRLAVIYVELDRVHPRLELNSKLRPLRSFLTEAFAVANAGYFTRKHRPTGLLVSDGEVLHGFVPEAGAAGSGVLLIEGRTVRLLERDQVGDRSFAETPFAIQAGPRVIEADGSPGIRSDDGMRANRTVLGRDASGRFAVAVAYGGDTGLGVGLTLFELQEVLGPGGLGAVEPRLALKAALNLDGGPSTGLHTAFPAPRIRYPAASRVVSVVTLASREDS